MKNHIVLFLLLFLSINSFAQKKYFQQEVNYKIDAKLDDENHVVSCFETIDYKNNSTDTLRFIIFHLWANAFKDDKSSYTEQEVENGDTKFYYSKETEKGFIDSLEFKVDGQNVNLSNFNNLEDVVLIELNHPLLPNNSIQISTPFRLVIPEIFSRLGHDGQNYQITQWYPTPAVYDTKGWHPLPYLDQGEFYNEFGSYEVSINLPKNYIVAATGELQTETEKQFIEQKIKDTTRNLVSSTEFKTINFKQNNVHDFAWFASKNYLIEKKILTLSNNKNVNCYAFYKPNNKQKYEKSTEIIAQTIATLSSKVGEYPYSQASVVDGKLLAGGGMEYPMITVIGNIETKMELQLVIIHEVGHNWFQGILGTNERDYAWMDEGINSYYENIIDDKIKKLNNTNNPIAVKIEHLIKNLNGKFIYLLGAKQQKDQAINTNSTDFAFLNYGAASYYKTASLLSYLKNYLGENMFDKAMQQYFDTWKFKHPYPEDFKQIFLQKTGKNLDWFFNDGLNSTKKIDYQIAGFKKENNKTLIFAKNKQDFSGPIPINAMIGDSISETKWIEYPYNKPAIFNENNLITSYNIDPKNELIDENATNNFYYKNRLFHRFKFSPKLGTSILQSEKNRLFILPALGYNYYDKTMLGLTFHNIKIPNSPFQFALAPMYSFGSKSVVGTGFISYSIFPKNTFHKVTFAIQGNTYHHKRSNLNINQYLFTRHIKIAPLVLFEFNKPTYRSSVTNTLLAQVSIIMNQSFNYTLNSIDSLYRPSVSNYETNKYFLANFTHINQRTFNPFSYSLQSEGNTSFIKFGLTANLRIDYHLKNKSFYIRGFAGKFFDLKNNSNPFLLRDQYINSTYNANNDYLYNDVYVARNEQKGILAQQISIREGGFKVRTNLLSNQIGISDNWLLTANLRTDIPIKLPIKMQLFLDAGTFANAGKLNPSGNKAIYDGGISFHFFKDILVIYAPLILCKDFKDYAKSNYPKNRLLNMMTFSLDLNKLNFFQTQNVVNFFIK